MARDWDCSLPFGKWTCYPWTSKCNTCWSDMWTPKNIKLQQGVSPGKMETAVQAEVIPFWNFGKKHLTPNHHFQLRFVELRSCVFIWMSDGYPMPRSDENIITPWLLRWFKAFGHGRGSYWDRPVMVTDVYPTVANQGLGLGFSILKV